MDPAQKQLQRGLPCLLQPSVIKIAYIYQVISSRSRQARFLLHYTCLHVIFINKKQWSYDGVYFKGHELMLGCSTLQQPLPRVHHWTGAPLCLCALQQFATAASWFLWTWFNWKASFKPSVWGTNNSKGESKSWSKPPLQSMESWQGF